MKRIKLLIFGLIYASTVAAGTVFMPSRAAAAVPAQCKINFLGFPAWFEYLDVEVKTINGDEVCDVVGPARSDGTLDIPRVSVRVSLAVIDILLRLAGIIAFFFIVYSGFKFTLSQGSPDKEKEARETAINAVIGMVIAMVSVGIVTFIGRQLVS